MNGKELIHYELYKHAEIDRVDDISDSYMHRARIHFKNGLWLSIVQGPYSYGGSDGLFEIMPSDPSLIDEEDSGDEVVGYLTAERVKEYIIKLGKIPLAVRTEV